MRVRFCAINGKADLVRSYAFEGYYVAPRHGGDRDVVSWRMFGLPKPPVRGKLVERGFFDNDGSVLPVIGAYDRYVRH